MKSMDLVAPEGPARVDALIDEAQRRRQDEPRAALALCRQARAMALRLDYQRGLAYSLLRGAVCSFQLAEQDQAYLAELSQSLALFQGLGDLQGEVEACHLLANVQASLNHYPEALRHYHHGLQLRRQLGDTIGEAGTLNNIGSVLRATAQFAEALKYLFMSLEMAEAAESPRATAYALGNIGAVLADLGDSRHAVEYHLRALGLIRLCNDTDQSLEGAMLTSLGRLLAQSGHTREAVARLEQARDIAHRRGRASDTGAALLGLGLAWQQAGEFERAERLLLEALLILRRAGHRRSEAEALLALGRNRWRQGAAPAAVELLTQALSLTEPLAAEQVSGQLHHLLSQIHEAHGRFEPALRHFQAFYACQQRIHGEESQRRVNAMLSRAELERAQRDTELERRRGDELANALDEAREADRQKQDLLAQLSQQSDMLRQLAREDGLTGMANRRWLDAQLSRERERARRYRHPLSLAMIDIDHFKSVNDRFSHRIGDEVLRRVGQALRDACRSGDIIGRYGGEEFLLVLVETPLAVAGAVCEKLRRLVAGLDLSLLHPDLRQVSVSIGVAGDAADPVAHDLVADADAQLYRAKREGRNRVCW